MSFEFFYYKGSASIFSGPTPSGAHSERPSVMQQKHASTSVAALTVSDL